MTGRASCRVLASAAAIAIGSIPLVPGAIAHAGTWGLDDPMPQPRRVELAFGMDLRRLHPAALPQRPRTTGKDARLPAGTSEPEPPGGSVAAVFLQSTAEAAPGLYLGLELDLGSARVTGAPADGDGIYWGAGAVLTAVPARGVVLLRAELLAGVRGMAMPAASARRSRWLHSTQAAVEPRLAIELAPGEHWSIGVHAGTELLPHRAPLLGVYVRYRGRATTADVPTTGY